MPLRCLALMVLLFAAAVLPPAAAPQDTEAAAPTAAEAAASTAAEAAAPTAAEPTAALTLKTAVMCEKIQNFEPVHPAVVFSISTERIICYNLFDPVPEQTVIFHKWYRRDTLSKRTRLSLKPPRWATFSSILLREGDKGPWRVEITDENNRILRVLRFSITD